MVPDVCEGRDADHLLHVRQRPAGDDHDIEIGSARRLIERLARRLGQPGVFRPGRDRGQRAIVIEEQRDCGAPRQPRRQGALQCVGR